jgi:glc operon protein GlcG
MRQRSLRSILCALAATAGALAAPAIAADAPASGGLTLLKARRVLDAAVAEARRLGAPGAAIAVVDAGGYPVAVERLDGTFVTAGTIALGKARTAAIFGRPTKALEAAINGGRDSMLALITTVGATPMQGGVPLVVDGRVVGGVGVAGAASADQDSEIAEAAAPALGDPAALGGATLLHEGAADVRAAFEAGKPLVENAGFKVHASRRVNAGEAEVHLLDTDVFYVLEGEATLVLGGAVTEPRHTSPTEVRGKGIEGGEVHPLKKGDVLVVPAGTPHWFKEVVAGPVLYYTVKSTGAAR